MKTTWEVFAKRYCETQEQTVDGLAEVLTEKIDQYHPDGFFIAEAHAMDSSWIGSVVILPYGPNNTFKTIPDHPFSPRGLASDMSTVILHITADDVPNPAKNNAKEWKSNAR